MTDKEKLSKAHDLLREWAEANTRQHVVFCVCLDKSDGQCSSSINGGLRDLMLALMVKAVDDEKIESVLRMAANVVLWDIKKEDYEKCCDRH